jgi:hypothetical protein
MTPELQTIAEYIQSIGVAGAASIWAGVGVAFYGLVKVFRLPIIQNQLPARVQWASLPGGLRVGLVLGLPVLAAVASAVAIGAAPGAIAGAGIAALVTALSAGGIDGAVNAAAPTWPEKAAADVAAGKLPPFLTK